MYVQPAVIFMILFRVILRNGIQPSTAFETLPDGWVCPACGAPKSMFVQEGAAYKEHGVR